MIELDKNLHVKMIKKVSDYYVDSIFKNIFLFPMFLLIKSNLYLSYVN